MALFEIEDSYIEQLRAAGLPVRDATPDFRRAKDHETFIQGVANNPKTRQKLLELIAETGTYVPEIEAAKPLESKIDAFGKKFDEYVEAENKRREEAEKKRETESTESLIERGRAYLRAQGWDDDGVKEIETFMRDNSVGSYEVANKHLKREKEATNPSSLPNAPWNGGRDLGASWFSPPDDAPDHKLLLKDPRAFTQQEIGKFFREKAEGRLQLEDLGLNSRTRFQFIELNPLS